MGEFRDHLTEIELSSARKEMVNEMSIAGYGNWEPSKEMVGTMSAFIIRKQWNELSKIKSRMGDSYTVYKLKDSYIAGEFKTTSTHDEIFEVYLRIDLMEHKSTAVHLNIHRRLMNVDGVKVNDDSYGIGLATAMYVFLVEHENLVLLSDEVQYFGARRLWSRLSKRIDSVVDIVDVSKCVYLERDVVIHHGLEDWEFDERVWDYTSAKKDIRLILKEIR